MAELVMHVLAVSVLMILGKMFPVFCYRDEASLRTRTALSLGMCPRGEVGAGVIVISLGLGIYGPAVTIAVICLALNLIASSGFILAVKKLADEAPRKACPLPDIEDCKHQRIEPPGTPEMASHDDSRNTTSTESSTHAGHGHVLGAPLPRSVLAEAVGEEASTKPSAADHELSRAGPSPAMHHKHSEEAAVG